MSNVRYTAERVITVWLMFCLCGSIFIVSYMYNYVDVDSEISTGDKNYLYLKKYVVLSFFSFVSVVHEIFFSSCFACFYEKVKRDLKLCGKVWK